MAVKRRRVAIGQTVEIVISEAKSLKSALIDKIGGEVRQVRILDGRVQILDPHDDTPWITYEPPFDLVGVHRDRRGLWIEPIPTWLHQVFRYDMPVSVYMTPGAHAVRWLELYTPFEAVRALRDEGYQILDVWYEDPTVRRPLFTAAAAFSVWKQQLATDTMGVVQDA